MTRQLCRAKAWRAYQIQIALFRVLYSRFASVSRIWTAVLSDELHPRRSLSSHVG